MHKNIEQECYMLTLPHSKSCWGHFLLLHDVLNTAAWLHVTDPELQPCYSDTTREELHWLPVR